MEMGSLGSSQTDRQGHRALCVCVGGGHPAHGHLLPTLLFLLLLEALESLIGSVLAGAVWQPEKKLVGLRTSVTGTAIYLGGGLGWRERRQGGKDGECHRPF